MTETETNGTETRTLAPATRHQGIALRTMDDLARFSKCVADSGLAPKDFKTPQAIAVAVQHGLELGLSPMQALHSIAVINGRPGLYGDAAKALVEASGLMTEFDEWFEIAGKRADELPNPVPDNARAVCYSLRRGRKNGRTSQFSVADAKRAGLWGKAGPWTQYTGRMLMFRARGFNLRDQFADVLKGIHTVEELQDYSGDRQPKRVEAEVVPAPAKESAAPAADTVGDAAE